MNPRDLTDRDLAYIFEGFAFKTVPRCHQLQTLAWGADLRRLPYGTESAPANR